MWRRVESGLRAWRARRETREVAVAFMVAARGRKSRLLRSRVRASGGWRVLR